MSLLTFPEAAERIHVSPSTARRLAAAGRLDRVRITRGAIRITAESVDRLVREGLDRKPLEGGSAA